MVAKTANRYTHPIIAELFFPLPHFSVARYIASNTSNRKKNWNTVCLLVETETKEWHAEAERMKNKKFCIKIRA